MSEAGFSQSDPGWIRSSIGTMTGGSATMRNSPSISPARLANTRVLSRVLALATICSTAWPSVLPTRSARTSLRTSSSSIPASKCSYQASRLPIRAARRILSRYSPTPAVTMARRSAGANPRSRPMISKLAARRLTSHSHGPGRVSSKSLMSNSMRRSGVPNRPKFDRWASPHSCTVIPVTGVAARSAAMISAAPR
jgi:hypothetical protein